MTDEKFYLQSKSSCRGEDIIGKSPREIPSKLPFFSRLNKSMTMNGEEPSDENQRLPRLRGRIKRIAKLAGGLPPMQVKTFKIHYHPTEMLYWHGIYHREESNRPIFAEDSDELKKLVADISRYEVIVPLLVSTRNADGWESPGYSFVIDGRVRDDTRRFALLTHRFRGKGA